jgi:amino acid permease
MAGQYQNLKYSNESDGDEKAERPCADRYFGPLTPGGFRSSLLTLCSSMIGVGFLTLPEIGKNSGLYPMIGFILLSAFISVFANWQIGRGFRATEGKTYSKIVAKVDGRVSSLINMIFLFLYVYVSAGAYYVFGSRYH